MCRVRGACLAILLWTLVAVTIEGSPSRLVELAQGPVRGYKDAEYDIYVFYSIPYAKAPTGTERFKGPLPHPVWTEVFEAVDKEIICPQKDLMGFITDSKTMQEDCLIADVYVPETKDKSLPVVVYVHGGAYLMGWGNFVTPKNLVKSKKIIAVTFNYRLGAHGFLCLGTKDVPGNAGMKDQVALLRWVKKNIASFGGNPDDITIAGYSAGASAVDLLMISKLTNNLFERVIPESGANTAAFSIQTDPLKNAKEYAKLISSDPVDTRFEDLYVLEDFYKTISYEKLNSGLLMNRTDSVYLMSPCVENDLGEEVFLDDNPVNILKRGNYRKVPMLYGFANMEGLFRIPVFDHWKDLMNTKFSVFLPADLTFKSESEKEKVAENIKRFYFGENSINENTVLRYIDYFSDIVFTLPTLRSVKLQVEAGNEHIYLYEYSYTDDDTPVVPYTNLRGANHCDQTYQVLDGFFNTTTIIEEKFVSDDRNRQKKIVREIWLNFITTGNPVSSESKLPAWPPVGANWSPHMSLNRTIQLKGSLLKERSEFWENIYEKYYSYPLPPHS